MDSSAHRSSESVSRQLTALFADTWRALHGSDGYRYRDLAAEPVPPLDTAFCALGRRVERHGPVPPSKVAALIESPEEERQWALTHPLISELLAADTVLIGAPMYNFSISALLKAWIDRVTFPGALDLRETRVVVITARGGAGAPDFQASYLRAYFHRYGAADENIHIVRAEMTLAGLAPHLDHLRPLAASSLAAARDAVTALVRPRVHRPC